MRRTRILRGCDPGAFRVAVARGDLLFASPDVWREDVCVTLRVTEPRS